MGEKNKKEVVIVDVKEENEGKLQGTTYFVEKLRSSRANDSWRILVTTL